MQPEAEPALQTIAECAALRVQDALTRNLARQFGPQSVRVVGVNPAWVKTEAITALASVLQVRYLKHQSQKLREEIESALLVHPLAWWLPWCMT
jgi:NAD(P)-dependent dehydrogenase (short-subunit alcohol dehydrogenase family)